MLKKEEILVTLSSLFAYWTWIIEPLSQIKQTNGFNPLCRFLCSFSVSIRVNFLPHKSQLNLI